MTYLAFLVAITYVPGVPSATLVGRWWAVAVGAALLLYRTPRLRPTPAHWIGAALLLWCAAGMFWSWSRWDTLGGLVHLLALAGVFCVAAEGEQSGGGTVAPMYAFGLGLVLSAVIAVGQQLGWQPVLNISDHPVGLFLSKNAATEAAVPVLVWLVVSVFETKMWDWSPNRVTGTLLILIPSALAMVVLPHAAEAWLMVLAAGLVVCYRWAGHVDHDPPAGISCRLGVLLTGLGVTMLATVAVATWSESETHSLNERLAIWQATLASWWLYPVGYGLGTYQSLLGGFEYAHNDYLQLLFETGPGLVLVLAFFWTCFLARAAGGEQLASKAALASLLASALVWWPLQGPASGFLAMVLAGGLAGAGRQRYAAELERGADGGARIRSSWGYGARALRPAAVSWDHMAY